MSILSSTKLGKRILKITRDKLQNQGWFLLDKISLGNMDYLGIRLDIVYSSTDEITLETSYTVVPYYITKVKILVFVQIFSNHQIIPYQIHPSMVHM